LIFLIYLFGLGDGSTDDTAGLSYMFYYGAKFGFGIFVPTGSYIIATPPLFVSKLPSSHLPYIMVFAPKAYPVIFAQIPINSTIAGACWSQFVGSGDVRSPFPKYPRKYANYVL